MAQRNNSRIDRFAQMSKQEELIAKKRQEILEKQRTAELAKKVAAQMLAVKVPSGGGGLDESNIVMDNDEKSDEELKKSDVDVNVSSKLQANATLISKTGKITFGAKRSTIAATPTEQPASKIQNSFCNDGSFLENFKKILEKQQQQQTPKTTMLQATDAEATKILEEKLNDAEAEASENILEAVTSIGNAVPLQQQQQHNHQQQQQHQQQKEQQQQLEQQAPTLIPPPPAPPVTVPFAFNAALLAPRNQILIPQPVADPNVAAAAAYFGIGTAAAPPPPPTPTTIAAMVMPMHAVSAAAAPPPPPPPQLPLALANLTPLYMIPAPEPLQLNAIPQPKEFDLNAIPKPQLNLEATETPVPYNEQPSSMVTNVTVAQEHQQQQAQVQHYHHHQQQPQKLQIMTAETNLPQEKHELQQLHETIDEQMQSKNLSTTVNLQEQEQQQQHEESQELHCVLPQKDDFNINNNVQAIATDGNNALDIQEIEIPTTLENLIGMVSVKGDAYEEILRGHKNQLHPTLWFICDKDSEPYHRYRQQVIDCRQENLKEQQKREQAEREQRERERQSNKRQSCSIAEQEEEEDKYDPESVISADNDSDDEYRRGMMDRNRDNIKRRIECRNELSEEERLEREDEEKQDQRRQERKKLRKSRWGEKVAEMAMSLTSRASTSSVQSSFANQNKPLLTAVTRNDPALLQYAKLNYGSVNLSEEDWKKCEEHYKVNLLYQDMMRKRQEIDRLARSGKFKYEYDSDEDVSGGTWEHKLRTAEMEATKAWASALTKQSEGKHHIGDFLPPEELKKFMEQYEAKKNNRQPDLSDYKEYKLKEDNKGFQMLQKLGWKEGQGLGQDGEGIVNPINKGPQREGNQGLGVQNATAPDDCDNEYDAYRKRMMLAYRFRPNPLNNPRRAYY